MSERPRYMDMARKYARGHIWDRWTMKDLKALDGLLRMTKVRAYADGFNDGAEWQRKRSQP